MKYRKLGRTGVDVSELCLGTMMFGGPTDEADSIRIIHRAIDDGVNFIDTANVYVKGESERIVGKAVRDRRDRVFLATKVRSQLGDGPNESGASRYHILREFDKSLTRLGLGYVDLYFLHQFDFGTALDESLRAMDDLVRQGKIRYVGCSNYYGFQVIEALWIADRLGLSPLVCAQPLYNLVNRDAEVELFPACHKYGVGVAVYSPLARGVLTAKYRVGTPFPVGSRAARGDKRIHQTELRDESFNVAQCLVPLAEAKGVALSQFALAWTLANRAVTSAIIGPRTMEQYEDNLAALACVITAEDESAVDALVPPGEHSGKGYNDPNYPVRGRIR